MMTHSVNVNERNATARVVCCPNCGSAVGNLRETPTAFEVRGVPVDVVRVHRVCSACGADFENTLDPDWRLDAFAKYRAKMGYVTPEQIKLWRASNGLTQAEVGELLGFGEATLGRYEKGSLQTAANNSALARIMTPSGLIDAIDEKPDALSSEKRHKILCANSAESADSAARTLLMNNVVRDIDAEYCGNREILFERVASFVRRLADKGKSKTVLNKLMFYSDFLAYRENGRSISGLCYARLPFGPVPNEYNSIFGILSAARLITIEPRLSGDYTSDIIRSSDRTYVGCDFCEDEIIIKYVIKRFSGFTSKAISDFSHEERAWLEVPTAQLISYNYARYLKV